MAGYNRNSPNPFVDGAVIEANDFDTEFGNLDIAFGTSGHNHNGTDGNGPKITTSGLADDAVTGAKIDSTTTVTAASFVGNLDANSATIDSLTITSGTAVTSIDTDLSAVSATDNTLASAKAIKAYVDAQVDTADQLTELTDVTITSVADNEVLAYNNATSKWINQTATEAGLQPNDAGLTSIAGLTTAADKMIYTTAADTYATTGLTAAGRAILDDANASAQRTTLGLAIGTNVQAYDDGLNSIAGLTTAADKMIYTTAADTYSTTDLTTFGRSLIDDANAAAARTTLGLGSAATTASTDYATSAQGTTADNALPKAGGTMTGEITFTEDQTFAVTETMISDLGAYITDYTVTETDVTAHEAALSITESQISDLGAYITDYTVTESDVTAHQAALSITESQISDLGAYITGNETITLSGDATGSGTTAITVALASNTVGVDELNLTDGTAGQFLKTDGAGNISFATAPTQQTSFTTLDVDNINLDGNTISSTDTDGDIILTPNGSGDVELRSGGGTNIEIQSYAYQPGPTYTTSSKGFFLKHFSENTAGSKTQLGQLDWRYTNVVSGSESASFALFNRKSGSMQLLLESGAGTGYDLKCGTNLRFNSGDGIDFSSDANASGMSSELFDDYEEGTFTPYYSNTSGAAVLSGAYEAQDGKYVKAGRLVHCSVNLALNFAQTKSISSGELCLSGMPFAPDVLVAFTVWPDEGSLFNWGSGLGPKAGRFRTSGNRATLFYIDSSRNYQKADINQISTGVSGNNPLRATFTYYTNS